MLRKFSIFLLSLLLLVFLTSNVSAADKSCQGKAVTGLEDFGVIKKFLSFSEHARPGTCGVKPTKIVMHTTWGYEDADGLWQYFETDPEDRGGASTHFVIGKDGKTLQMVELYTDNAEITWAVSYYNDDSISIELGHKEDYGSKGQVPQAQYAAAIKLVQKLMDIYDIPIGSIEFDYKNASNKEGSGRIQKSTEGIFGHYQLSPDDRSDPGAQFLGDFREDLKRNPSTPDDSDSPSGGEPRIPGGELSAVSNCVITKVGDPKTSPSPPPDCGEKGEGGTRPPADGRPPSESCKEPPNYPSDLRVAIADEFAVDMVDFDEEHLRWTWKMLWCMSGTKFISLIGGTTVRAISNVGDSRMSCSGLGTCYIQIGMMPGRETAFTFLLTHELGHVVNYGNSREEVRWTEHENAFAQEGGISYYGRNAEACTGSDNRSEDYADMLAYYLHPKAGETTPACDPDKNPPNPFFELNKFPLHMDVAEMILL